MCRALRILCAAPEARALATLRHAASTAAWELVGGATTLSQLVRQVDELQPDVVVIDARLGTASVARLRRADRTARIVSLGVLPGADAQAATVMELRDAILDLPRPGGPVRR